MWWLVGELGLLTLSYIYHRYLQDQPVKPPLPDVQIPQFAEGTPYPLIYGKSRIRTPINVWAGNRVVGTIHNPDDTTTPLYSIDIMLALGIPFYKGTVLLGSTTNPSTGTGLGGCWAGDSTIGFGVGPFQSAEDSGLPSPQTVTLNEGGGETALTGGGLFYNGNARQDVGANAGQNAATYNAMTASGISGLELGGFRNVAIVAFMNGGSPDGSGLSIGTSPDVPGLSFEAASLSTGTASDLGQSLTNDADPAAVIYDLLTSPWGKLGLSPSLIDLASFQAASLTLFNEGHGYSRVFDQADDATNMITDILRQIDAVIYQEPTNGLIVLKLIRADYDPLSLADINPDNAAPPGSGWYQVQGWAETPNQVRLTFTDRANAYNDGIVIAQSQSNAVAQQGRLRSLSVQFPGCCTADLAQKLASRELAVVSRPLAKATVVVNRTFYQARIGGVYTLTWPELGINKMIMRVAAVDFGQLHDGKITLQLMRDVFDVTLGAYPVPAVA